MCDEYIIWIGNILPNYMTTDALVLRLSEPSGLNHGRHVSLLDLSDCLAYALSDLTRF